MQKKYFTRLWACAAFLAFVAMPAASFSKEAVQEWELVNPEGVIKIEPMKVNPHPETLEGKTVLLRWNGKHNGDNLLSRVGELLQENVKDVKVIKSWEIEPWTAIISGSPSKSQQIVDALAKVKPDLVIGSQCD